MPEARDRTEFSCAEWAPPALFVTTTSYQLSRTRRALLVALYSPPSHPLYHTDDFKITLKFLTVITIVQYLKYTRCEVGVEMRARREPFLWVFRRLRLGPRAHGVVLLFVGRRGHPPTYTTPRRTAPTEQRGEKLLLVCKCIDFFLARPSSLPLRYVFSSSRDQATQVSELVPSQGD